MAIIFHEASRTFHLGNAWFSYIFKITPEGFPAQLYFGAPLRDKESFDELFETAGRGMAVNYHFEDRAFSLEHMKHEFPSALAGDTRPGAIDLAGPDGSHITDFRYRAHRIEKGKPALEGLPACYVENDDEAETLVLELFDEKWQVKAELLYTVYNERSVLCRSVRLFNEGQENLRLESLSSLSLDLPDDDYERIQLAGAWARERHVQVIPLHAGYQSIYSLRGHSSHNFNPFLALKRPWTTEQSGEAIGLSFVYSGNFEASVDVDTYHTSRVRIGLNPLTFSWPLDPGTSFQSPEAVLVYAGDGLNAMSQTFHELFARRLARGVWRDKPRPILLNSWEGVYFNLNEDKIVDMARGAKELGVSLFVLDDGWFKGRNNELSSLGDWIDDFSKLPHGLKGLCEKINALGLDFGLWIEPEMVSTDSDLYRTHPEWRLEVPGRHVSAGRHQYVLDFSNPEVVDYIANQLFNVLDGTNITYIKWDMNRTHSEVGSSYWTPDQQGTIWHRFILGVYSLYEKLIERYPNILFESCASGGARFDPGMLYYAPQAWTSDDTDAIERLKIQFGTSMVYPISSMGTHVSAVPNHQLHRITPLKTRGDVAYFGTFGYEFDPTKLSEAEKEEVRAQIRFMKAHRELIQFGTFYRLRSPFEGGETAWMVVSKDKKQALIGYYRPYQEVNSRFRRLHLMGLDPALSYAISEREGQYYGDELMYAGMVISDSSAGENNDGRMEGDYLSRIWLLQAE